MARRSNEEIEYIEGLIKKIKEEGENSPSKIKQILEEKYGQKISKQTLLNVCAKFSSPATQTSTENDIELAYEDNMEIVKINERIKQLEKDFKAAVSVTDRCKLSGQLDSAQESKMKLKKILREADMMQNKAQEKKYIITFGEPTVVNKDTIVKKENKNET